MAIFSAFHIKKPLEINDTGFLSSWMSYQPLNGQCQSTEETQSTNPN